MGMAFIVLAGFAGVAVAVGVYGFRQARTGQPSRTGWYGLALLVTLFVGLLLAGQAGNEPLGYLFGAALMLATPMLIVWMVATAIGYAKYRRANRDQSH